jgi:ribosomal protein S18 acetylase RimI-like enzyme
MSPDIARARESDLPALAILFDAYRRFYQQPADTRRAETFLRERMQRAESVVLLARLNGEAVGFTQLYPLWSSVHTARVWLLNDLYVASTARRHGIARSLLAAAGDFCRSDGARGLQLETANDNIPAQKLYEACGWTHDDGHWWYTWQP